jgi:hypothetical protein
MDRKTTFIGIGFVFWLSAAVLMHFLGPLVFDGGIIHGLWWLANFGFGAVAIILIARLTGRTKHDMLVPTALMAMPAMLLDGVAVTLDARGLTHVYADQPLIAAYTGGFLLFAFWSFFFFALIWHRPHTSA